VANAADVKSAGVQRAEAEAALHSVQGTLAEATAAAARADRRVMLLTKERDGLNRVLASFEAEATDKSLSGEPPPSPSDISLHAEYILIDEPPRCSIFYKA